MKIIAHPQPPSAPAVHAATAHRHGRRGHLLTATQEQTHTVGRCPLCLCMTILIDDKEAILKKGSSFDYISENRLFTGSDSYTLTMTFPLADCPQNRAIFGNIDRKDVVKEKVVYDCVIMHGSMYRQGVVTITEITDMEVKTQFLEGRSAQNFESTFDNTYINEFEWGQVSHIDRLVSCKPDWLF